MYLSVLIVVVVFQFKLNYYATLCASQGTLLLLHQHQVKQHRQVRSPAVYDLIPSESHTNNDSHTISNNHQNNVDHLQNYPPNDKQPAILEQCCACDEAKYELVFEGLWSKYTHPDEFPENQYSAGFSDLIGASHSNEFRLWQQGTMASEGVKELAESGSTKKLESELKQVSSKTRTIIKARELRYPTLNSKTSAVFRTDRQHHLVSILSKVNPSPDWMVGVSGLELCQLDCSWISQRIVNLYLWDAGTDSGTSLTSSDSISQPQERIHPYRKSHNKQGASNNKIPFDINSSSMNGRSIESAASEMTFGYSSNGNSGQTTTSNNQRRLSPSSPDMIANQNSDFQQPFSYPQTSTNAESNQQNGYQNMQLQMQQPNEQAKPFARLTITRQRIYEKSCNIDSQTSSSSYYGSATLKPPTADDWLFNQPKNSSSASDCRFTEWSDWSSCSSICGKGIRTRTRAFVDEQAHLAGCSQADLIEKEVCLAECFGNDVCITRDWSDWSECSVNCGQGQRQRTRTPIGPMKSVCKNLEFVLTESCTGTQSSSSDCTSSSSVSTNRSSDLTQEGETGPRCKLTDWSQWSECSVACGRGIQIRTRQFVRKEDAERKACSFSRLVQKQSCAGRFGDSCSSSSKKDHQRGEVNPNLPVVDCKLSAWSPWSTCSALCGSGKRTRSRHIIQMPQNGGKACDRKLTRTQSCKNLPLCPPSTSNYYQQGSGGDSGSHSSSRPQSNANNRKNHSDNNKHQVTTKGQSENSWRTTTTTTTTMGSSMLDDEDDKPEEEKKACEYGNWSQWSDCEVVCQPVKKGSNKRRQKLPIDGVQTVSCQILEEFYYCDPNVYC